VPLSDIRGQAHAIETLHRALAQGRVHHAYLFSGPDGVGKAMAAHALAQALLCQRPVAGTADACGRCSGCLRAASGEHPDLHVVRRREKDDGSLEAQLKVEQIRELQQSLTYKAYEGARRIVVLHDAERMNASTANALLKTLEEPGAETHFVLVSSAPNLLLPTILSRCQRVRFGPLPRAFVAEHLAQHAELPLEHADLVAGLAEGSIGRGLRLAESPLLAERAALLGRVDDPEGRRNVPEVLALAEQLAQKKPELPLFFQLLRTWYRDLLLVQRGLEGERLVHRDQRERLHSRAERLPASELLDRLGRINDTERAIEQMANARLSLETLLLRLVQS
jgi:DNA polymerase-3 subunit delta'